VRCSEKRPLMSELGPEPVFRRYQFNVRFAQERTWWAISANIAKLSELLGAKPNEDI
jgi:hypothetical protein